MKSQINNIIGLGCTLGIVFSLGATGGLATSYADELSGPVTPSALSGKGGHTDVLNKSENVQEELIGVTIGEKSDEPCFLEAHFRNVQTGERSTSVSFAKCSNKAKKREGKKISHRTIMLPEGVHATGARICLNNKGERLKGIQLIGSYTDCIQGESVTLVPQDCSSVFKQNKMDYRLCNTGNTPSYKEVSCKSSAARISRHFERTNCPGKGKKKGPDKHWKKEVSCPSGMIATGMRLSTRKGGSDRRMIDGVGLECRTLGEPTGSGAVARRKG